MRVIGSTVAVLAGLLLTTGCLERTDRDLPVSKDTSEVRWELAGSWGGPAEISTDSSDPWQVRFVPGTFKDLAGICATADEVWVCDTQISRLQIFDFNGNFLRSIGEGMPLDTLLPTVQKLHQIEEEREDDAPSWEEEHAAEWVGYERERFRVTDVAVTDSGYWVLDQTKLNAKNAGDRLANLLFFPNGGEMVEGDDLLLYWPEYLCVVGDRAAYSQPIQNEVTLLYLGDSKWVTKPAASSTANVSRMLDLMTYSKNLPNYEVSLDMVSEAGNSPGQFNHCSGLALAFDKLIVCDTRNKRLKIFDARHDNPRYEGRLVKIINHEDIDNTPRFNTPRDIDVDNEGLSYVLDEIRLEVGVLDQAFNRIGTIGRGDLLEPHALDLSDDGQHCFVTDRRYSKVWHYVRID